VRVVLDANVLASALLSRVGAPAQLVERWLAGELELVVSATLLDEVARTPASPKLGPRIDPAVAERYVAMISELAEVVADTSEPPPVRSEDPGDDYLVGLAARERVRLVSGDAHLLALRSAIPVLTPRDLLDLIEGDAT
jgi:putative PIN family toxin of toxin-antitoxin system